MLSALAVRREKEVKRHHKAKEHAREKLAGETHHCKQEKAATEKKPERSENLLGSSVHGSMCASASVPAPESPEKLDQVQAEVEDKREDQQQEEETAYNDNAQQKTLVHHKSLVVFSDSQSVAKLVLYHKWMRGARRCGVSLNQDESGQSPASVHDHLVHP